MYFLKVLFYLKCVKIVFFLYFYFLYQHVKIIRKYYNINLIFFQTMYIFKTYLNIIYMQYQADIEQLIEFLFFLQQFSLQNLIRSSFDIMAVVHF